MARESKSNHACFGAKTVLEVYPQVLGEGRFIYATITKDGVTDERKCIGNIKLTKVKCEECGSIYLETRTFPKNSPYGL